MEDVKAILRSFGARKSEVQVFIFLSGKEPQRVQDIVAHTKLSEKTVRTALKSLEKKGLVKKVKDGRSVKYRAVSLKTLLAKFNENVKKKLSEIFGRR